MGRPSSPSSWDRRGWRDGHGRGVVTFAMGPSNGSQLSAKRQPQTPALGLRQRKDEPLSDPVIHVPLHGRFASLLARLGELQAVRGIDDGVFDIMMAR